MERRKKEKEEKSVTSFLWNPRYIDVSTHDSPQPTRARARVRHFHGYCNSVVSDFWSQLPSRGPRILIRVLLSFPPVRLFPLTFFVLLFLYRYSLPSVRKVEKSSSLPLVPAGLRYTFASSCLGRIIQSTFSSHDDRISLSLGGHVYPDRASADPFQFQPLSDSWQKSG